MKSVSSQNLIGGFLGGTAGILVSWFVSPLALPFGVLLGVVVGWWNEEIVQLFGEAHRQAKKTASGFVGTTDFVILTSARLCGLPSAIANVFRWIIVKAIIGSIVALVSTPARFARWLASHPTNRTRAIDITISLIFIFGTPVIMFFLEPHVGIEGSENRGVLAILGVLVATGGSTAYRVCREFGKKAELNELGQFYREWEIISRHGSVGFFLYAIAMQIRYMIGFAVFCIIAVPWFFAFAIVGFLGIYPLIAGIAVVHGFYKIANRSGHWLCLGVTMAVTGISWLVCHKSFPDPRILWITALGTGIISGGVTEFIRRFMLMFYENTATGRRFVADSIWELAINNEDDKGYFGVVIFKLGGMWFRNNQLARIFRAFCFNTPVAQPVLI